MNPSEVAEATWIRRATERPSLWLAVAVVLTAAHFARLYDGDLALLTDTRYYTYFGTEIANGAIPHRDYFGNKTQLASMIAAGLLHLGGLFGDSGLATVRMGFIFLTATGGVCLYLFHRTVTGGQSVPAMLGLLPYLGLTYIGTLPATGSIPKLVMAISATGAALAVVRHRWFAAGLIAALSPLDWQIGVFACFGVFAAAALDRQAKRALLQSMGAVALIAILYLGYFALHGALEDMLAQTIGASFARGVETGGPLFKFASIYRRLVMHCTGEFWLVVLAAAGFVMLPFWFCMERLRAWRQPLVVIAVYHYGVAVFSAIDFQGSGDTMLLLHTLAFFAGVALISVWFAIERSGMTTDTKAWAGLALVVVVAALARPVVSNPTPLFTPDSPPGVTLQDQSTFARRLAPIVKGRSLLVLGPTEQLILGGFPRESIFVYWNDATEHEFARTRNDASGNLLASLITEVQPDVIVASVFHVIPEGFPYAPVDLGRPGGYGVNVFVRTTDRGASVSHISKDLP